MTHLNEHSLNLVETVYKLESHFPIKEKHCLSAQIRRCSVSIPSNIAEGYGRNSSAEFIRFLCISRGSLYELQTQTEIAKRLRYIDDSEYQTLNPLMIEVEKMLNSLIRKL